MVTIVNFVFKSVFLRIPIERFSSCLFQSSFKQSRFDFSCKAKVGNTSFDPDVSSVVSSEEFKSPEVLKWFGKIEAFSGKLVEIPDSFSDRSKYDAAIEANATLFLSYVRTQAALNGVTTQTFDSLTAAAKAKAKKGRCSQEQITVLKKIFSYGKLKGFMDACSAQLQYSRDLSQQLPDLGITPDEFQDNIYNLKKISVARSAWGRFTSDRNYVENTSYAEKLKNQQEMSDWFERNRSVLSKIVDINVTDIPYSYDPASLGQFQADPSDPLSQQKLEATVLRFKQNAIQAWRKDKNNFDLDKYLGNF